MGLSMAMIALGPKPQLSGGAIKRHLAATWPVLPPASDVQKKDNTLSFEMGDQTVIMGLMPAPIPWSDLEGPCKTSWLWPDAAKVLKEHKNHLVLTVSSKGTPVERAALLSVVAAAILKTCPQAVGVLWGLSSLVISPPVFCEFAEQMLPKGLPLYIWVDFRVVQNQQGRIAGFTQGMEQLGHMEFETLDTPETPQGLRERMFGLASYVLENGPVIKDGDTIGEDANEKIRVVHHPSAYGNKNKVMRLEYGGSSGTSSQAIDDAELRRKVLDYLRSPAAEYIFKAVEVPFWLSVVGAALLGCAGLCMLPTIIWTLAGLRALWSVLRLEQFRVPNARQHPEKLVPVIGYSIIVGPDKRHGLILATFGSQSQCDPSWMADKASRLAELDSQAKAGTSRPEDEPICALLREDSFRPSRRRKIPESFAKHADLWMLDVEADPKEVFVWPDRAALFAFVAEPGERGDVVQIPWKIVASAVRL